MPNPRPTPRPDNLTPGAKPTGRQTFRQSASIPPELHEALTAYLDQHTPSKGAGGAGRKRSELYGKIVAAGMEALQISK